MFFVATDTPSDQSITRNVAEPPKQFEVVVQSDPIILRVFNANRVDTNHDRLGCSQTTSAIRHNPDIGACSRHPPQLSKNSAHHFFGTFIEYCHNIAHNPRMVHCLSLSHSFLIVGGSPSGCTALIIYFFCRKYVHITPLCALYSARYMTGELWSGIFYVWCYFREVFAKCSFCAGCVCGEWRLLGASARFHKRHQTSVFLSR